jgi:prepilin-type N-terminal cleavage/methylation domain-containing protein
MRRAFTMLELVLAMLLASLIMAAAFGMFGTLRTMDSNLSARFEGMVELGEVHATMRRAAQSLIAYPSSDDDDAEVSEDVRANQNIEDKFAGAEPRFYLGSFDPTQDYDKDGAKRLEMVLTDHPLAPLPRAMRPVRAAFDLIPGLGRDGLREWALFYTPLEPPGEPILLMWDLELAEFAALDGTGWHDQYVAMEKRDFPWAIRVVLWKRGGARADWVLEPGVRELVKVN